MTLKPNQQAQVNKAPPKQRAALRQSYERQNKLANQQRSAPKPQPRPKKAAAQRPGIRSQKSTAGKTCVNFMDPMCPLPTPTTVSAGKALSHTALASNVLTLDPGKSGLVIAMQYGGTSTVGYSCIIDDATGLRVNGSEQMFDMPTLMASDTAGGPTSSRAMRLSCSVVNTTNQMNRGGSVCFINSAQRLNGLTAPNNYTDLLTSIRESPYRKVVNGDALLGTKGAPNKLLAFPTDMTLYNSFNQGVGQSTQQDFLRRCFVQYTEGAGLLDGLPRSMSIIAWVFDPPPEKNTYRITMRASYYTRWPLESVPGHHMKPIPAVDPSTFNGVMDHVENHATTLLAEGGLGALVAPKVLQGLQYLGRAAQTAAVDFMAGGYGMGAATGALTGGTAGIAIEML